MEVESDNNYRNGRRSYPSRWELIEQSNCRLVFSIVVGLLALLIDLIVQAVTPAIERVSWLAPFWRAVSPWLTGCSTVVFLICAAVVAWNGYLLKLAHDEKTAKVGLLEENHKQSKLTTRLLEQAYRNQDNIKITHGDDHQIKSVEIVRTEVILEQTRIQEAARAQIQLQKEERKQIAAPAGAAGGRETLTGGRGAAAPVTPARASRNIPEAAAQVSEEDEEEMAEKLAQIPAPSRSGILTFAELLDEGIIQAALAVGLICLGYVVDPVTGDWVLRFGTWLHLYSCGVGGVSGSGKTTTVRFLLFQAILAGAKLLMVDPAIHEPKESLAAQFSMFKNIHLMKPCDDNPEAVTKRIRWFWKEYLRRKAKGIVGPAYIFVLDEFNEVVALLPNEVKKELAELLVRIAQSGRKYGLFVMVIGQRWSEQDLGGKPYGSQIRTSLAATLVHRFNDEEQAKKLATSRYAADCPNLRQGHYFFRDTQGQMSYTITPDTVAGDGVDIQYLLDELENTVESSFEMPENTLGPVVSGVKGQLKNTGPLAQEAASQAENTRIYTLARQVLRLQAENVGKPDIMRQVWKVNPGGTDAYQQALEEYKQVMAFIADHFGA